MPDSKITALTSISTSTDPANDPLVIVDVSDTSMAATGTTKKVTLNQLLGASGTATLASATISGDLTVDTSTLKVDSANNRVGIGTASPTVDLEVGDGTGTRTIKVSGATNVFDIGFGSLRGGSTYGDVRLWTDRFRVYNAAGTQIIKNISGTNGDETWYDGAGGTRMTLNSTGLGVGASPTQKLSIAGAIDFKSYVAHMDNFAVYAHTSDGTTISSFSGYPIGFRIANSEKMRIDTSGNVGIGVTPSAWSGSFKAIDIGSGCLVSQPGNQTAGIFANSFANGTNYTRKALGTAAGYDIYNGAHYWLTAASGAAGSTFAFGDAKMTLDASGILAIGTVALGFTSSKSTYFSPVAGYWIGNHTTGTPSGDRYWGFGYGVNEVGSITQNGTTGVLYNITSDYRLKEQVQPLVGGLARVNALKPSVYKWKSDGSNGEGFLAHELAEVVPFAVSGEKDAVNEDGSIKSQGIDMSRVVPILVAAIQELTARVQTLETR